jgi:putative transcriptional regulator
MPIINKLKEIRLEQEINQTEMAKACEVSRQTIHSIEVSKYVPSVELALKIAEVLNMSVEDIFELKGE